MGIPLLALNPTTCVMLAEYHEKAGHTEDYHTWLRTALTLQTVHDYNNGRVDETTMRDQLSTAHWGRNEDVIILAYDCIRPSTIDGPLVIDTRTPGDGYVNPEITDFIKEPLMGGEFPPGENDDLLDRDTESRR
jgi:hypothetical protein